MDDKNRRLRKFLFPVLKLLVYFLVWIALVGAFTVFGLPSRGPGFADSPEKLADTLEGALSWGGHGTGVATCIVAAWWLITEIRRRNLGRISAMFCYLTVCTISIFPPGLVMESPDILGWKDLNLFQGEQGLGVFVGFFLMFWTAIAAAVLFILCALIVKKRGTE